MIKLFFLIFDFVINYVSLEVSLRVDVGMIEDEVVLEIVRVVRLMCSDLDYIRYIWLIFIC